MGLEKSKIGLGESVKRLCVDVFDCSEAATDVRVVKGGVVVWLRLGWLRAPWGWTASTPPYRGAWKPSHHT